MKKTMQELIVGHYEGSLTSSQEKALQSLLATSPEARALYEHHGAMQEAMEEESDRLVPPIGLREATIGAALGVGAEVIGGGLTAWLTTKMAVAIGSVVVGGAAVGVILSTSGSNDGDNAPAQNPPAAVSAPAMVGTVEDVAPAASAPVSGANEVASAKGQVQDKRQGATQSSNTAVNGAPSPNQGAEPNKQGNVGAVPSSNSVLEDDPGSPTIDGKPHLRRNPK